MAGKKINVALVGVGWMGEQHLDAILGNHDYKLVAVADTDQDRARDKMIEHHAGSARLAGSYSEVVDMDDVDLIVDASPNSCHELNTHRALAAGKDVFSEKPGFVTEERLRNVARTLLINPERRFFIDYVLNGHRAYDDISSSLDGRAPPTQMELFFCHQVGVPRSRDHWKNYEGMINNAGAQAHNHALNLGARILSVSGTYPLSVQAVFGRREKGNFPIDTLWTGKIRYNGGHIDFIAEMDPGQTAASEDDVDGFHVGYHLVVDGSYASRQQIRFNSRAPPTQQLTIIRPDGCVVMPDKDKAYDPMAGGTEFHPTGNAHRMVADVLLGRTPYEECPLAFAHLAVQATEALCLAMIKSNDMGGREVQVQRYL